ERPCEALGVAHRKRDASVQREGRQDQGLSGTSEKSEHGGLTKSAPGSPGRWSVEKRLPVGANNTSTGFSRTLFFSCDYAMCVTLPRLVEDHHLTIMSDDDRMGGVLFDQHLTVPDRLDVLCQVQDAASGGHPPRWYDDDGERCGCHLLRLQLFLPLLQNRKHGSSESGDIHSASSTSVDVSGTGSRFELELELRFEICSSACTRISWISAPTSLNGFSARVLRM